MSKDTGGLAFPAPYEFCKEIENANKNGLLTEKQAMDSVEAMMGMTLRDYFAAKAMQALIASERPGEDMPHPVTAGDAYRIADAMLEARNK